MSSGSGASGASKVSKVSVQEQEYELTEYGFKRYNICGMRFEVTPNFAVKKAVGQGAYGLVCSGSNTDTGNKVAIKKIPKAFEDTIDCKRLLREIKMAPAAALACAGVPADVDDVFWLFAGGHTCC